MTLLPQASAGVRTIDPETGETRWDFKQYVALAAGNTIYAFALP